MKTADLAQFKLPDKPGVYYFLSGKNGETLYIGKATSLRDRVRSYFSKDLIATRGPHLVDMVFKAGKIKWQETDSVLEALILEANLIKKYQPYYNKQEKDDKSWNYVVITKEDLPRILLVRGHDLEKYKKGIPVKQLENTLLDSIYGPFTQGGALKEALKIIRRIFPYIDASSSKRDNFEFYRQLGLTPDISRKELIEAYCNQTIKNLKLLFQGKKKIIIRNLKKEMMDYARAHRFEEAEVVKRKIFALEHIRDVSLIKEENLKEGATRFRIEAYDIAHMSGKNMVGVLVVVTNGTVQKSDYRKFIIRTQSGSNDTGALEELLSRRFRHSEWGMPDLVVVDGALPQKNVALQVLKRYQLPIPVVAVVKDERHRAREILGEKELVEKHRDAIILANAEAHRFGITFHKNRRAKNFLPK